MLSYNLVVIELLIFIIFLPPFMMLPYLPLFEQFIHAHSSLVVRYLVN